MIIGLPRCEKRLLALGGASYSAGIFAAYLMPLQISELIEWFGLTPTAAGALATGQLLILGITALLAPWYMGRVNRRALAITGLALAVGGLLAVSVQSSFVGVAVALIISGVGQGAAGAASNGFCAASRNPARRFSQVVALGLAYCALCLFIVPAVPDLPLSAAPAFLGCAIVLIPCLLTVLVTRSPNTSSDAQQAVSYGHKTNRVAALALFAGAFLFYVGTMALWAFSDRLAVRIGFSRREVSLVLSFATILSVSGPVAAGALLGRLQPIPLLTGIAVLTAASCFVSGSTDVTLAFEVCIVLQVIGQMAAWPLLFDVAMRLDPNGRLAASLYGIVLLGTSFGPLSGGYVYSLASHGLAWFSFISCISGAALAIFAQRQLKEAANIPLEPIPLR